MKELTTNINGQNIYVYTDCMGDVFLEKVDYEYNLSWDQDEKHSPKPLLAGISTKGLEIYVGIKHNQCLDHMGVPGTTIYLCDKDGRSLLRGVIATLSPDGIMLHPHVNRDISPFHMDEDGYTITGNF